MSKGDFKILTTHTAFGIFSFLGKWAKEKIFVISSYEKQ
jgi:hypothetical protein